MLTSIIWAPDSTCARATATAASPSPARTSRAKCAEPVTFVRSPTLQNPLSFEIATASSPETRRRGTRAGTTRGARPAHRLGDRPHVLGRAAAAASDQVHQAVGSPRADVPGHLVGAHVVVAEVVRQPGVRVRADRHARDARELGDVRAQLGRAERAVQADGDGRHVLDRDPERLGRLPAERTPASDP